VPGRSRPKPGKAGGARTDQEPKMGDDKGSIRTPAAKASQREDVKQLVWRSAKTRCDRRVEAATKFFKCFKDCLPAAAGCGYMT